ncbi:hypothetical protein DSO57_1027160 [Entomophthora muscae]|uniref:Uncharacterized protein n=1 Tax=Entomophthora muscae TaxID=34485 RepID=A0ACC2RT08_9FUNG|nr:hypothetical protein DSO57_1027160 [Entomophthora muscae]
MQQPGKRKCRALLVCLQGDGTLHVFSPCLAPSDLVPLVVPVVSPFTPTCTPWLLAGLMLMDLNAYFPQMSPVSPLWSPLQAAVPVLHWAASWCFISPGWEPDLVSLAPLSHNNTQHFAFMTLLKFKQNSRPLQTYVEEFTKLQTRAMLVNKLAAILFRKGMNPGLKDLLKYPPNCVRRTDCALLRQSLNQETHGTAPHGP